MPKPISENPQEELEVVKRKIADYLTRQFIGGSEDFPEDECLEEAGYILSQFGLALISRDQTLPKAAVDSIQALVMKEAGWKKVIEYKI
jgi:hypothetical protein